VLGGGSGEKEIGFKDCSNELRLGREHNDVGPFPCGLDSHSRNSTAPTAVSDKSAFLHANNLAYNHREYLQDHKQNKKCEII